MMASKRSTPPRPIGATIPNSANLVRRDGFFSDGTGDEKGEAARAGLRFEPLSDVSIIVRADFAHQGGKGPGATGLLDTGFAGDPWDSVVDQPFLLACPISDVSYFAPGCQPGQPLPDASFQDNEFAGVSAQLDWQTPLGTLTFLPAYRSSSIDYVSTIPGYFIIEGNETDQTSFELRLASGGGNELGYVIGAYYLSEGSDGHAQYEAQSQGRVNDQYYRHDNETAAVFGQLTLPVTSSFRATARGRWTYENKQVDDRAEAVSYFQPDGTPPFSGPPAVCFGGTVKQSDGTCVAFAVQDDQSWDEFTWKVGLEFDAAAESLLYANAGTGFKAGGFFFGPSGTNTYEPEHVTAYTLGSKNQFLDDRLRLNGEIFLLKYKGQRAAGVLTQVGGSIVSRVTNAGQSTSKGAEVEIEYLPLKNTMLSAQVQYLNSNFDEFTYSVTNPGFIAPPATGCTISPPPIAASGTPYQIDCSGMPQIQSPKWAIQLGLQQTIPLASGAEIILAANSQYQSSRYTHPSFLAPTVAGDFTQIDLEATYYSPSQAFSVSAYVRNLENDEVFGTAQPAFGYVLSPPGISAGLHYLTATLRPPRTFGVRLGYNF